MAHGGRVVFSGVVMTAVVVNRGILRLSVDALGQGALIELLLRFESVYLLLEVGVDLLVPRICNNLLRIVAALYTVLFY